MTGDGDSYTSKVRGFDVHGSVSIQSTAIVSRSQPYAEAVSKTPRVSIGLPVYNGERFIADVIESHLAQSFGDFELIISDNCSSDGTEAICRRFAAQDKRVRFYRQERNIGVNLNYEFVFERSSPSEFFRWADADDRPALDLLERMVTIMVADAAVVLVVPNAVNIDSAGSVVRQLERTLDLRDSQALVRARAVLTRGYQMVFTQGLIRRAALEGTARRWHYFGWDHILLLELALQGEIAQPADAILYRRLHGDQASRARTMSEVKRWVDPSIKGRFLLPNWRLAYERVRGTLAARIAPTVKLTSLALVLRHAWWVRHALLRDLRANLMIATGQSDEISF